MTFNAAFPSSPLSRSALRSESETSKSSMLFKEARSFSDQHVPGPSGPLQYQSPLGRRVSEGHSKSSYMNLGGHLSNQLNQHPHTNSKSSNSFRQAIQSTTPPMTPPLQSPASFINTRSLATSPLMQHRKSPSSRSTPLISNRRRYSEQSPSSSIPHHSPGPNFGSLVGSYEESLLSGRMSSLPSKPLIFDAELGVLGLGKCKPSLKCPPHVNINFPAHFYNLDQTSIKEGSTTPGTPYVGTIDVESYYLDQLLASQMNAVNLNRSLSLASIGEGETYLESPRVANDVPQFPGYKVPPKGQIQLVIKNPNLTAVKLFLVPYDFTDMPAGTKTFIRQKSHVLSTGAGSDDIQSTSPSPTPLRGQMRSASARETLRYAIHLQFCAVSSKPSMKGRQSEPGFNAAGLDRIQHRRTSDESEIRFKKPVTNIYLHKNIRVVFAARVPDSTEKLRVVTETPGGSDGNSLNIYSTYYGPSDEWKEAKKATRDIRAAALRDSEAMARDDSMRDIETFNDDPNGENWFANGTPDEEASSSPPAGVDIPLTTRSPWHEEKVNPLLHGNGEDMVSRGSAPASAIGFSAAAFDDGKKAVLPKMSRRSTTPEDQESLEENRALLDQWHSSIGSRSLSNRPTSPASASKARPTSPTLVKSPTSPTTVGRLYTLMNRSTSSQGIPSNHSQENMNSSGDATASNPLRTSPYRHLALRPLTPQRTGEGINPLPNALSMARPLQASLDLDHANGILDPQPSPSIDSSVDSTFSSSSLSRRPSLLRRLSSHSQLAKQQQQQ